MASSGSSRPRMPTSGKPPAGAKDHAATSVLQRILRADQLHRSRLHDEKGNMLPPGEFRHLAENLFFTVRRKATGRLPARPWIAYNAITRLESLLRPDWTVVEFGSGASTQWYARRVGTLHSIESDESWYRQLKPDLPANVRYELRGQNDYPDLRDYQDRSIDLVIVDGIMRAECMEAAIPKVKLGGWIYLDNSDKDMTIHNGDVRRAEAQLRHAVQSRGGNLEVATGLTVGLMLAQEWQLAQLM